MGSGNIVPKAAINKAPLAYIYAFGFPLPALIATIGAHCTATRFKELAILIPVPRFGVGKTLGVYVYSTPYMIFWNKASRQVNAS